MGIDTTAINDYPTKLFMDGKRLDNDFLIDTGEIIPADRCDVGSCSAGALVRAVKSGHSLLFCGNHAQKNLSELIHQGFLIDDQTYRSFAVSKVKGKN